MLAALAGPAYATIGMAEREKEFHYNRYAVLMQMHNDICTVARTEGKDCLVLRPLVYDPENYYHLMLDRVSVPKDKDSPFVLGELRETGRWVVYDLTKGKEVFAAAGYDEASREWKRMGLKEPVLASVRDAPRHFRRTWRSIRADWIGWVMIAGMILVVLPKIVMQPAFYAPFLGMTCLVFAFSMIRRKHYSGWQWLAWLISAFFLSLIAVFFIHVFLGIR